MAKVTNKDIARRAGVSQAAVSMAIHGKPGISEATRTQILQIAREMNYMPPVRKHSVASGSVILLAGLPDAYMASVTTALLNLASRQGAELRIYSVAQVLEDAQRKLAGCSLLVACGEVDRSALALFESLVPRILIIDGSFACKPFLNIRIDYAGATYALTSYLAKLGHRNFIYLNKDLPTSKNLIAFNGFQRLTLERHLALNPEQIIMSLNRDPEVWSHFSDIIQANNISAIVCTSAQVAAIAVNQITKSGLQVPEDISVAAVTDGEIIHPCFSFTHVSLNTSLLGEEILRRTTQPDNWDADVLLPVGPVIQGASTDNPKFNPASKKLAIALYLKDHPTMRVARAGFLNHVQIMGYQAEVVGTPYDDDESFTEAVKTLLDMDVDGVALWLAVPEAIHLLTEAGIPSVCLHGIVEDADNLGVRTNITEDPLAVAKVVADFFSRRLRGKTGSVALTQSGDNPLETGITREFTRLMQEACPGIVMRNDLQFVHHTTANIQLVTDFIERTPDLLGAFITAGDACVNWAAAKKALGRDDLLIVGTDYTDDTIDLLKRGDIQAFVAQPIYEETQTSVVALDAILRGKDFPPVCKLDAPLITVDNVEKYSRLLQEVQNWYV